ERGGKVVNNTAVTALDPAKKTVTVKNVKDGTTKGVSYDKLIISSRVNPASLPLPGSDLKNIMMMRGYDYATEINAAAQDESIKNVAVIGAGNGIAAVEVFSKASKNVTLIVGGQKPLENYLNDTYTSLFEKELNDHGVNLA